MKKRIIAIILCIAIASSLFSGCDSTAKVNINKKFKAKAQLVIAANPVLVYDDQTVIAPVNDIKKSIDADRKNATLTSLSETDWSWITKTNEDWQKRALYDIESWKNGTGAQNKNINSYVFSDVGTISLANYNTAKVPLITYGDEELSQYGLLFSVSAKSQDALCYTVPRDGTLTVPETAFTAVEKVGNVKTGFLAEDGSGRSAVVSVMVNGKTLWYGMLCNTKAGDGQSCSQLKCPELNSISVTAGDTVTFNFILNARANKKDDITQPDSTDDRDDKNDDSNRNNQGSNSSNSNSSGDNSSVKDNNISGNKLSLIDGYDVRFKLIRSSKLSAAELQKVVLMRTEMEKTLGAETFLYDDETHAATDDYEILIGDCDRPESKKVYNELIDYRAGHAADYIIRIVGKKLVIAATTEYSLANALEYFIANYCKDEQSSVPSDLNYVCRPKIQTVMLGNNNIGSFAIRTERYPSVMTVTAAKDLQNWITEKTGYTVNRSDDRTESTFEILLYATNRSGYTDYKFRTMASETLAAQLGLDNEEYKITFDGKKLYINAGSVSAANYAVQQLISEWDKKAKNGSVRISAGYEKTGIYKLKDYSLSDGYALTWTDEFTGNYDDGTRLNRKNWDYVSLLQRGPMYEMSKLKEYWGINSLAELKAKFTGNWITGDYTYNANGIENNITVPEGSVVNGFMKKTLVERKDGTAYIDNNALRLMRRQVKDKTDPFYDGTISDVGAEITSNLRMSFKYGIFETRIINPVKKSCSPVVWLNCDQSSFSASTGDPMPEIDICESFGHDNRYIYNLHTWFFGGGHTAHGEGGDMGVRTWTKPEDGEKLYDTYHTMGCEITPEYLSILCDGEPIQTIETNNTTFEAFHKYVHVRIGNNVSNDTYVGDNIPLYAYRNAEKNADEVNNLNADMYVDYVSIYQKNDSRYGLRTR